MEKLTEEQRQELLKKATKEAATVLYMTFVLCELKTHMHLTCDFGSRRFKLTFEPVEKECDHYFPTNNKGIIQPCDFCGENKT